MKKSVILMAGLMAMAMAGSAQAAGNVMFEVQNTSAAPQFTATDLGDVEAKGSLTVGGKYAGGLTNAPYVAGVGTPLAGPFGPFHVATKGNAGATAAFIAQNVTTGTVAGGFPGSVAPSFSFYRVNQDTGTLAYVLPLLDNTLGNFTFGTINTLVDPNLSGSRKNAAAFAVRAESAWSATGPAVDVTPTYFIWSSSATGGTLVERMRLSSAGNLGIGTTGAPTSKLQVVGLPVSADETGLPVPAGLTSGAFYRTPSGVVRVAP